MIDKRIEAQCGEAIKLNKDNCLQIIGDNSDTAFGKEYGFSDMKDVEDFRNKVPLAGYEEHKPYIRRMLLGEDNVLTKSDIIAYCHTSGTTGGCKLFPATAEAFDRCMDYPEAYQKTVVEKYGGKRLMVNTFRVIPGKKPQLPVLVTEVYYKHMMEKGLLDIDSYVGGEKLLFDIKPGELNFAKVWAAFLEKDISIVECIYMYDALYFFSYMEKHWQCVIDCIRKQIIPEEIRLSDSLKDYLLSIPVDIDRIDYVENECKAGFEGIGTRLWKNLRLISGISNRAFSTEETALERYVPKVHKYYLFYCSSECHIGHPVVADDFGYVMIPSNAFYELLPYSENDDITKTCLPHEAKIGEKYEVVCTTFSGLYRYRMGDIVQVRDFVGESPVMEFVFRKGQYLNIAGEKTEVIQLEKSISDMEELGIHVEEYCFGESIESIPGRYLVALVIGKDSTKTDEEEIADILDDIIRQRNFEYNDLRNMGNLSRIRVCMFDRESYKVFLSENGLGGGHNKPRHIAPRGFCERSF
ncbi:MAG: GH3 auxin-responsive promoter family protein [Lachnospiraceae bacterium]|nr:GH3 auxin-responsive promoter family protein [Lachnospiraceae bacterium]